MSHYQEPVPQQPNPYDAYPYQDTRAPRGLAIASAVLAGVVMLLQLGAALTAPAAADSFAEAARGGRPALDALVAYDGIGLLLLPSLLAAYIVTCLWLTQSRTLLRERGSGYPHERSKVWVWLGWWVPPVLLWFPFQVVRDVWRATLGFPGGSGILAGWWTSWLVFFVGSRISNRMASRADGSDPSALDALPWVEGITTIAGVIALAFWLGIIRQVTRGQEAVLAAPAGSAPTVF